MRAPPTLAFSNIRTIPTLVHTRLLPVKPPESNGLQDTRMLLRDGQQLDGDAPRLTSTLFPVVYGVDGYTEQLGELALRGLELLQDFDYRS